MLYTCHYQGQASRKKQLKLLRDLEWFHILTSGANVECEMLNYLKKEKEKQNKTKKHLVSVKWYVC